MDDPDIMIYLALVAIAAVVIAELATYLLTSRLFKDGSRLDKDGSRQIKDGLFSFGGRPLTHTITRLSRFMLVWIWSWPLNALLLMCIMAFFFAVTNRLPFSIALTCLLYYFLVACNMAKLRYLHSPLHPLDTLYLSELMPALRGYMNGRMIAAFALITVVCVVGLVFMFRVNTYSVSAPNRLVLGVISATILIGTTNIYRSQMARQILAQLGIRRLLCNPRGDARRNGILLQLFLEMPGLKCEEPDNYNETTIKKIVCGYESTNSNSIITPDARLSSHSDVNVIVVMVESFMDPADLGVEFSKDPIPTFRALTRTSSSGYVLVPDFGRGSANSEFELLTGMSMLFLPPGSCPYRQSIRRIIPTLPWLFKEKGYRTAAIHADSSFTYSRKNVYRYMGFDNVKWLRDEVAIDRDITGRWVSDEAVIDEIISKTKTSSPCFVFAFTEATHAPYQYGEHLGSGPDITSPMPEKAKNELRAYINALHDTDRALARLVDYCKQCPDKILLTVIGDHLPPFSEPDGVYSSTGYIPQIATMQIENKYRVPVVMWANFETRKQNIMCGLNFLGARILENIQIAPTGFFSINNALRSHLEVMPPYCQGANGALADPLSGMSNDIKGVVDDYRSIQYDLLFGQQHALKYYGHHSNQQTRKL